MNSVVWRAVSISGIALCAGLWMPRAAVSESIILGASKDNTLFGDTTKSNGAGEFLFAGRTGFNQSVAIDKRRALLAFDVSDLPEGALIDSVSLTLRMSRSLASEVEFSLHKLLSDWGEGTSDSERPQEGDGGSATLGDATWNNTFFPGQFWSSPGGDFEPTASASQNVSGIGFYSWSSPQLAADVQSWIDRPESNFGWLLKDNELFKSTAKQFVSRDSNNGANRPALSIEFSLPDSRIPGDANDDNDVDRGDLLIVANHFGSDTAEGFDAGDFNNSGAVDLLDLAILSRNFGRPAGSPVAAVAVPEPTAVFLSLSGLLAMFGRHRTGGWRHD